MDIDRKFFTRHPAQVAADLLGCLLIRSYPDGGKIVGKIVETEAYGDENDLASHARFGKTKRSTIMFGHPGNLYVYSIYGIFYLTNIICEEKDKAGAVLIRSVEIIRGEELAQQNLSSSKFVKANNLIATGPGKLSLAFGIDKDFNGKSLFDNDEISIDFFAPDFDIIKAKRVGIDYAGHCRELPWRFYIKNNPFVSKK